MPQRLDAVLLRQLFYDAPVGFAAWDADMRFILVNERLARIHGVPAEDHIGRRLSDVIGPLGETAERAFAEILETGVPHVNVEFSGETPAQPGVTRHFLA